MVNRIIRIYPRGLDKGINSRLSVDCRFRHETNEEGRKTDRPKRYEYEDEGNNPNILSDKKCRIILKLPALN